jgi:hypothetical protein
MANRKWKMEKAWQFAISHLPFPIRPGFFSGLLGSAGLEMYPRNHVLGWRGGCPDERVIQSDREFDSSSLPAALIGREMST